MSDIKGNITLSIDAMGGDNAPKAVVQAAVAYHARNPNINYIFVGEKPTIIKLLDGSTLPATHYHIIHTKDVVASDEQPVQALRSGRNSSMRKAIDMVKDKAAHACLSAGNTGALMMMSKFVLGGICDLKRPAITSVFPNKAGGGAVLLDVGANAECDSKVLSQFAFMGVAFAKTVLNINIPRVGLLNIGSEAGKGRDVDRETFDILSAAKSINFIGNIEPADIVNGKVDVVVADGFTGNITIKVAEATSSICMDAIKNAIKTNIFSKFLGLLLKRYLKKSFALIDHRKYNGAMFVGVNGIVVKSHGSSDTVAFEQALDVAHNLVKRNVNKHLTQLLLEQHGDVAAMGGDSIIGKIKKSSAKIFGKKEQ